MLRPQSQAAQLGQDIEERKGQKVCVSSTQEFLEPRTLSRSCYELSESQLVHPSN